MSQRFLDTLSASARRPWFFSSWSAAASNAHHRNVAVPCCRVLMVLSECVGAQPEVSGPPSLANPCGHQTSKQLWRRVRGFVVHPSQRSMSLTVSRPAKRMNDPPHAPRKEDYHNHTRETPHPEKKLRANQGRSFSDDAFTSDQVAASFSAAWPRQPLQNTSTTQVVSFAYSMCADAFQLTDHRGAQTRLVRCAVETVSTHSRKLRRYRLQVRT